MAYCVIRTDNLSGTDQRADLFSLRFCTVSTAGQTNVYTSAAVENGVIAKLVALENGSREVYIAVAASETDDPANLVIVAGVELDYKETSHNLDAWINPVGKVTRGYLPRKGNVWSITKEGFVNGTVPAVGGKVGIGDGGKLDAAKEGFATCIAIESDGRYTYYVMKYTGAASEG